MRIRRIRLRGFTLPEALVVVSVSTIVLASVAVFSIKTSQIYASTSAHIEPQASQMLALKRMERDIREAMFINTFPSTSAWIEVILPHKDPTTGLNTIVEHAESKMLGLKQGKTVRFFLGFRWFPYSSNKSLWYAIPSTQGDTLFRADDSIQNVLGMYKNAPVVVEGIKSQPVFPDPHTGQEIPVPLFAYWPSNDNGTPDNPLDDTPTINTRLVKITLTIPVRNTTTSGTKTLNHTLWTQFCLRNLQTSQQGQ